MGRCGEGVTGAGRNGSGRLWEEMDLAAMADRILSPLAADFPLPCASQIYASVFTGLDLRFIVEEEAYKGKRGPFSLAAPGGRGEDWAASLIPMYVLIFNLFLFREKRVCEVTR